MPVWSVDGTRLYFRDVDRLLVADVETDAEFVPGPGETVARGMSRFGVEYDVAADGRVLTAGDAFAARNPANSSRVDFIVNWLAELKRLVPTGR